MLYYIFSFGWVDWNTRLNHNLRVEEPDRGTAHAHCNS